MKDLDVYHPVRREALRMFRQLHGRGDGGSESEFRRQNPALIEGWYRLARQSLSAMARLSVLPERKPKRR